jgi:hypothetical protein
VSAGFFLDNLVLFGRLLRGLGLEVDPGRIIGVVKALDGVDVSRRQDFYHAVRSLLVFRREDLVLFDQAFDLFWRKPCEGWIELDWGALMIRRRPPPPLITTPPLGPPKSSPQSDPADAPPEARQRVIEVTRTYSNREVLGSKDFADLTGEELQAIKRLIAEMVFRLGERRTRRHRPGSGTAIDFRRTLRQSLRHGGEVLLWSKREPRVRPRPLVVLADVSGSMERYTRLLLHFLYCLAEGLEQTVEAFVFSTRLTRISRHLRGRDVERALDETAGAVPDWSGGTKIGEAIKAFNFDWARRVLGRGAVVLLISDGWDRGEVDLLRREMARLQRSCHRLIWLNPLLGSPEYEPLTRGMQAALPYVDDFLPVHNLASLEDLGRHLAGLGAGRRRSRREPRRRNGGVKAIAYGSLAV